jgi:hypothetical protein
MIQKWKINNDNIFFRYTTFMKPVPYWLTLGGLTHTLYIFHRMIYGNFSISLKINLTNLLNKIKFAFRLKEKLN